MSSGQVRSSFESAWASLLPGLTLYATINEEPDRSTLPDNWATVDYLPGSDQRQSLGDKSCWREQGTILAVVYCLPGLGDAQAVTLADQVRDTFRDWKDSVNNIRIVQADPPESDAASDGRWFAASVSLAYQYDRYI